MPSWWARTPFRRDNLRLLVRSADRQNERIERRLTPHPLKVTLTGSGGLDANAKFFTAGETEKLVYTSDSAVPAVRERLGAVATVVAAGAPIDLGTVLDDLADRKVRRLMVEGGGLVHTQFLTAGLVDEIHLVIAPFFVGDRATRSDGASGTAMGWRRPGWRPTWCRAGSAAKRERSRACQCAWTA